MRMHPKKSPKMNDDEWWVWSFVVSAFRNQVHPGWTASSATSLTSFSWRTLPPSKWKLQSWWKSFQIYGKGFNKLRVLEHFFCNQEASRKTDSRPCTPEGPIFFYAYCYTSTVLFLALSQSEENVRLRMFFFCFFVSFLSQWIKTRKRGTENISTLTLLFLESSAGLFWEWMRLRGLKGGVPVAPGCLCTD